MAAAFIDINKNQLYGNAFWAVCRNLVANTQDLRLHLDAMTSMKDGDDYTKLAEKYGIDVATAAGVYAAVSALVTALEGNAQIAAIRGSLGPIR